MCTDMGVKFRFNATKKSARMHDVEERPMKAIKAIVSRFS